MSLGGPRHGARVWCLGRVPKHRNHWQDLEGLLFSPKNSQLAHILSFHSYLRACMKLRIVQKIRFSLHESGWTKAWCPGLVPRPSAKAQKPVARSRGLVIQPPKLSVGAYFELLILGCGFLIHLSKPGHLGPPRLKKANSNFFTNRYVLHTLKNEPLNIMLLHTGRTMDGPGSYALALGRDTKPGHHALVHPDS